MSSARRLACLLIHSGSERTITDVSVLIHCADNSVYCLIVSRTSFKVRLGRLVRNALDFSIERQRAQYDCRRGQPRAVFERCRQSTVRSSMDSCASTETRCSTLANAAFDSMISTAAHWTMWSACVTSFDDGRDGSSTTRAVHGTSVGIDLEERTIGESTVQFGELTAHYVVDDRVDR